LPLEFIRSRRELAQALESNGATGMLRSLPAGRNGLTFSSRIVFQDGGPPRNGPALFENQLGVTLICMEGLRLMAFSPVKEVDLRRNCPDLYGGIETSSGMPSCPCRSAGRNCPDLYGGIFRAQPRRGGRH